ncbi:enhanced entry virulence factor RtxA [Legionella pneumophila]|uniref:enhanced entry virulence factor RtxA n=2 Tax=Legionella pneumophila TaxID=446 RepID=UPI000CA1E111|nr:hypothetical protein BJK08_03485 [Legionella pneumophila]
MLVESVIGIVRAVNGLLEKVNAQGQASLVKSGARLEEGDVLTLLSGEAYIQFIHGFPEALALGKPVKLDGVSPALQNGVEDLNEQLVQEAIAKGIDPSVILDVLGSAAAGAVAVGSGGDAFIIDPLFGFGQVTAGYPTGPISFAYEADTQQLFWFVPEDTGVIAESESITEPEFIPQIPQFTTNQSVLTVFEDALPSGIPDSAGQARTASSSLSSLLTSSPDVASSFAFNTNYSALPKLTSDGIDLIYSLSADKRTLSASTPSGAVVMQFELTADGQLTQTLMDSIDHPTADGDDSEWMRLDLSPLIDVTFTRTSDGTVLESRTLPANAVVAGIQDDVPIARAQLTNNEILLDETIGMKVGDADAANDDFNPTTTVDPFNNIYGTPIGLVQNAKLIDTSTSEMGGDYKNATMAHFLKITNAVSGLQATDGTPINLFLESNGDITGRAGDIGASALFAIRMNPNTGAITVAQYGPIKQFDTSSHDEAVDLTGRISALVIVIDGDGDVSNAEIPIGQLIVFEDDGPVVDMSVKAGAALTLDETKGAKVGDANANDEAVSADANDIGYAKLVGSDLFTLTKDAGSDGEQSTLFKLVVGAPASGLVDTATNQAIVLSANAGGTEVLGKNGNGDVVFKVALNASNGDVEVFQYRAIKHENASDHDESGAGGIIERIQAGSLKLEVTVTDKDGDSAKDELDLGQVMRFEDDGPVVDMSVKAGAALTLDETKGAKVGDANANDEAVSADANDIGYAKLVGSDLFTLTKDAGSDGEQSTLFKLVVGAPASGLVDTATNQAIVLSANAGGTEVLGKNGNGDVVFKVALNASNGDVEVFQYRAIKHENASDHDESGAGGIIERIQAGSLKLEVTVTDKDGDSAKDELDLGQVMRFEDDGPVVDMSVKAGAALTLDETKGAKVGDANANDEAVSADANDIGYAKLVGSDLFTLTKDAGSDGEQSTLFKLVVGAPASGLVDTATNQAIVLSANAGGTEVLGKNGNGDVVFKVALNASNGDVEVFQYRAIKHENASDHDESGAGGIIERIQAGSLKLEVTVTDKDGDSAKDELDLGQVMRFEDDGPVVDMSVKAGAALTLDETKGAKVGDANANDEAVSADANDIGYAKLVGSDLFTLTKDAGSDGEQSTLFKLVVGAPASGLVDTATNQAIVLSANAGGTEVLGKNGNGDVVFKVALNASNGDVEVFQYRAIKHENASDHDESGAGGIIERIQAGSLKLEVTVTDKDGDSAKDELDLGQVMRFEDDGPVVDMSVKAGAALTLDETKGAKVGDANANDEAVSADANDIGYAKLVGSDLFTLTKDAGSDGEQSTLFKLVVGAPASGLVDTATNQAIVLSANAGGTEVLGKNGNGDVVFKVALNASNGDVEVFQYRAIKHENASDHDESGAGGIIERIQAGSLKLEVTVTDKDGDSAKDELDLGQVMRFEDDGPVVDMSVKAGAALTLDETKGAKVGDANANDEAVSADANDIGYAKLVGSDLFTLTKDAGSDGEQSTLFKLVVGAPASGLVDTATNQAIVLSANAGGTEVLGKNGNGDVVFKVALNASNGDVEVFQYRAIKHENASDHDESGAGGIIERIQAGSLKLEVTVTDKDGDSAKDELDLGQVMRFEDDGPVVDMSVKAGAALTLDETKGAKVGDANANDEAVSADANDIGYAKLVGSDLFTLTKDAGSDGEQSTLFKLVVGAPASGLVDTATNQAIVLSANAGGTEVLGKNGNGDVVFKVALNASNGDVEVFQYRAIKHENASDHDESGAGGIIERIQAGSLKLEVTVTDKDGDSAKDELDLGQVMRFEDDGPVVDMSVKAGAALTLDETKGAKVGDANANDEAVSADANDIGYAKLVGSDLFTLTKDAGSDGEQSTLFKLVVGAPASGLVDTATNQAIVLSANAGGTEVLGKNGNGDVVFKVALNASNGDVEVFQYRAIKHENASDHDESGAGGIIERIQAGSLKLEVTVTDKDGDSAKDELDLGQVMRFEDDGPVVDMSVKAGAALTLDETKGAKVGDANANDEAVSADANDIGYAKLVGSDLFTLTKDAGSDGEQSTLFKLVVGAPASGLVDTATNQAIVLSANAGGTEVLGKNGNGDVVFKVALNASNGDVEVFQYRAIKHENASDHDESGAGGIIERIQAGSLKLEVTVTDKDGDSAKDELDLGQVMRFEDDGPVVDMSVKAGAALTLDETKGAKVGDANANDEAVSADANDIGYAKLVGSDLFTLTKDAGSDGEQSTLFKLVVGAPASGLVDTATNQAIVLSANAGGTEVLGKNGNGDVVFKVALNASNGDVEVFQYRAIKHENASDHDESGAGGIIERIQAGSLKLEVTVTDKDGDSAKDELDLGQVMRFEDDGPVVDMSVKAGAALTLDETKGAKVGDANANDEAVSADANDIGYAKLVGSDLFTLTKDAGSDGEQSTLFKLVVGAPASGLVDTATNQAIVLSANAGGTEVLGKNGNGDVVFKVALNASNGDVEVFQYRAIKHENASDHDESGAGGIIERIQAGSLKLEVTVTDKDGDSAKDELDLGQVMRFEDDGPVVDMSVKAGAALTLDETKGAKVGDANANDEAVSADANDIGYAKLVGSDLFTLTKDAGSDGEQSTLFKLVVGAPASGLVDTATNQAIVLSANAGGTEVLGKNGNGDVVFKVALNASNGDVEVFQYRAIKHENASDHDESGAGGIIERIQAGSLKLEVTVTDKDGDSAKDELDLGQVMRFEDDGPVVDMSVKAGAALTLDETKGAKVGDANANDEAVSADANDIGYAKLVGSDLFTLTKDAGSDGEQSTLFKLVVGAPASGLVDTATNQAIVLSANAGGTEVLGKNGNGDVVFKVALNASNGDVEVFQYRAIKHENASDHDESGAGGIIERIQAGSLKLEVTVTDKDGDSAKDELDLGQVMRFEDDGPVVDMSVKAGAALTLDETKGAKVGDANANDEAVSADANDIGYAKLVGSDLFTLTKDAGSDGEQSTLFKLVVGAPASGLVDTATNQAIVLSANAGGTEVLGKNGNGDVVFKVALNASNGDVEVFQYRAIKHENASDHDESGAGGIIERIQAGSLKLEVTVTDKDGDSAKDELDLGQVMRFEDDGPVVDMSVKAGAALTLDETKGAKVGDANANDEAVSADANDIGYAKLVGSDLFTLTKDAGSDGEQSTLFKLVVGAPASGLVDTATNQAIVLSANAGGTEVLGKNGNGDVVFKVALNASNGDVEVFQYRAIKHENASDHDESGAGGIIERIQAGSLKLEVTVTDKDGDSAKDELDLGQVMRFEDDGPVVDMSVKAGAALTLDETKGAKVGDANANDEAVSADANDIGYAKLVGSDLFTLTKDAGSDGEQSTLFKLVVGAPASGLVDTATNQAIVLSANAGGTEVLGKNGNGDVVFKVALNASNGDVEVFQYRAIKHENASDHDESGAGGIIERIQAGSLKLEVTVTDKDGDSAKDELDLGQVMRFEDDGPVVDMSVKAGAALTLDETKGAKVGDANANDEAVSADANDIGYAKLVGSDLFTLTKDAGSDGEQSTLFKLVVGAPASGLVDTATNQAIVLSANAGGTEVLGKNGNGDVVFKVALNASNGDVEVFQYRAIKHENASDHDESGAGGIIERIQAGSLKLEVTVTDKDGDSAKDELDLGQVMRFEDDGPVVDMSVKAGAALTLDETKGAKVGDANANDEAVSADANDIGYAKLVGSDLFTLTKDAGSDGEQSTLFKLVVGAPASGLVDTATNQAIVLSANAGGTEVLGKNGNGDVVFKVALNASNGDVEVFQYRAIKHENASDHDESGAGGIIERIQAGSLKLEVTVTDKDGDSAKDELDLGQVMRFEDDGPTVGTISLVADEDNLPRGNNDTASGDAAQSNLTGTLPVNFGADGAGSVDFQGMHGLSAVIGNDNITYNWSVGNWSAGTNTLTAYRTGGTLGVNDVFKIVVNPTTGQYTFTLLAAINHHAVADNTEGLVDPFVNLNYRVIDGDGDTAIGTLKVTIDDDIPKAITPEEGFVTNQAGIVRTFDLDFDANIDNNVGADQLGTITFSGITNGQVVTGTVDGVPNQTLTSGGSAIHYYVSGNNVVEGWINGGPGDVGSTIVFRTTLQPDMNYNASNDTYKFELFQPISTSTNVSIANFSGVNATSREFIYLENASGPGEDILFSAYIRNDNGTFTDATVNTNPDGIGVNNQNMNDRENLRVDFVRNASTTGTNQNMTYEYDDHYLVNNFSFKIIQVTGNPPTGSLEVWVRAYNADDDDPTDNTASSANNLAHQDALRDDPQVALTQILVNGVPVTPTTVNASGGYLISGLNLNDTITIRSANGYDRVEIENPRSGAHGVSNSSLNNETFDIGLFSYNTIKTTPSEININMGLSLTDSDGDKINSSIEINLAPSVFKVGENVDDTSSSNVPHRVGGDTGVIDGSGGADILVGDVGGVEVVGTTARLAFILDESGSMSQNFGGTTRLEVLKQAMTDILTELSNTPNASITVHLVKFASVVNGTGTFEITGGGLQQALDFISGLQIQQGLLAGTNYEAALGQTVQWFSSQSGTVDVQQTLFFTDGVPTFYMDGNSTEYTNLARVYGNGSQTEEVLWENLFGEHAGGQATSDRINNLTESDSRDLDGLQSYSIDTNNDGIFEIQSVNSRSSGTTQTTNDLVRSVADTFNEVQALQAYGPLRAVSIADNANVYLQEIDSTGQPYLADSPEVLQDILDELNPFNVLLAAGSDTIQANQEDDLIFGDVLFTDKLAEDEGLDLPKGSGWAVFEELEANHGWSRQDTLDYIRNHADELGRETVLSSGSKRSGGHDIISGGQGDDRIYGQEGNDVIDAGSGDDVIDAGSGDDVIVGGTGNDTLTGGSGADQFVFFRGHGSNNAGTAPTDIITDFEVNIDKIVINANNIIGVSVSNPVSNPDLSKTYTITVNYSDAPSIEHFKVTLSNGALLNDSGKTHLNGVVISGGTATIDGTIVGAVLYLDLNANNQEDEGERLGITNQYGHVEWVVDLSKFDVNGDGQYVIGEARAVQTGGFDIDTGLSYEINLYGPVGSAVISPLTSLLQAQLEAGMDYETANAALVARLGLPEGTQIISFNPITGSGEVLAQNAGVMTAAIQFAEIAAIHYSTDEGHVSFAVFEAISKALLELPEGVVADFGDEGFLQSIANYLGLDALVTSDMIDYMATSQKALEASILTLAPGEDALTAISKIQHVTQGIYAQAIEMALIGYLPLDALKNMSAVLKAYADGDITDEQLNSFEDKLSAVIVNWEDNNVTDASHQATLQTERTVDDSSVKSEANHEMAQEVNAVINDFMDEHNISLYYYDQQAQMPQETQEEQQPVEAQAEETVIHDDVVQDLLLDDHSLTMLANNPELNGGNGNDVLHGTTGNDFIRGGQGNDTMTGGGGVDTFFWLSGDDDGGVDTITDFKANPVDQSSDASVLNLSDLLSDADLETNSLDNYLNVSTTEEGDTAIKVDPNGNGNFDAPAQTIILEDVDLTAVFATNNSHDIVNQMIANGNLIVEQ